MYHLTAHLRMNAIYWGLTALCIMKQKDALSREEMIDFVMSCWDDEAGLSPLCSSRSRTEHAHRRIRRASGPRRTHTSYAECDSDIVHARCHGETGRRPDHEV